MQLHLSFLLFLLLTLNSSKAQPLNTTNTNNNGLSSQNFNPSMAIVIVVLISAFFFLGFFSIYIRQCTNEDSTSVRLNSFITRSRRNIQRGLPQETINTFPTFAYSEVKAHKIGKGSLECAVCLSEFEDDETLRLLPRCNHVFHPDCIDAWLSMHVTCPVCRADLSLATDEDLDAALEAPSNSTPVEAVVIDVERDDLDRIGLERTAVSKVLRSHSTGHSVEQEAVDRFTLRLPEHIRREIMAARKFQRSASCVAFPIGEEGSTRRGLRWFGGGEGSSRGGRSVRLGKSDRWPSFFARTFSAKFSVKRGRVDGEGSMKRGEAEGSTSGKISAVIAPFDCLGVGGGGAGAKGEVAGQVNV